MQTSTQESITALDYDIFESANKIRVAREQANSIVQQTEEWKEVEQAKKVLEAAQTRLKIEVELDHNYTATMETLAELQAKQKDLREIMSHHLIKLKIEEHIDGVPTSTGFERPVVLKAKLGKEQPDTVPMDFHPEVAPVNKTTHISTQKPSKWPARNRHQKETVAKP